MVSLIWRQLTVTLLKPTNYIQYGKRPKDGSSSIFFYVPAVIFTTDLPTVKSLEDKVKKKSFKTSRRTKSTNTKFANHTEYVHIFNNSEKCSLSLGKKKNVDGYKNYWKHTVVHTDVRDTTGQQQEREGCREESKNKRTDSLLLPNDGQILQNILLTIFTKITGSGQIFVSKFSANVLCFSLCRFGFKVSIFWFVCKINCVSWGHLGFWTQNK